MNNVTYIDEAYTPFDRLMDKWSRNYHINEHTLGALARYLSYGYEPGHFLMSVLTNDLFGAMRSADAENKRALPTICYLVYNEFPSAAWHNVENINTFMKMKRSEYGADFGGN